MHIQVNASFRRAPKSPRLADGHTRTACRSALRSLGPKRKCAYIVHQINGARNGGCGPSRILTSTIRNNRLGGRDPSVCRQLYFRQNESIHDATCCLNGFPNLFLQRESCRAIASLQRGRVSKSASRRFYYHQHSWIACNITFVARIACALPLWPGLPIGLPLG